LDILDAFLPCFVVLITLINMCLMLWNSCCLTANIAIFIDQTTTLMSRVVRLLIRLENQAFVNYWPSFGY